MSEHGGPDRRRATRHRAGKPYEKNAKDTKQVISTKSSFSSLLSIFTAPFRRTPQPSDDATGKSDEPIDEPSDEEGRDSSSEIEHQLPTTSTVERENAFTSTSQVRGSRQAQMESPHSRVPPPPQLSFDGLRPSLMREPSSRLPTSAGGSIFGAHTSVFKTNDSSATRLVPPSHPFSPSAGANQSASDSNVAHSVQEATASSTPQRQTSPATSQPEQSPYKEIVDFLQTKKDDKLNHMEIIGLTQSLRKNATRPAQEMINYMESTSNVPSAALLGTFKQPPDVAASPNRPLLFPPSPTPTASASPARNRRRRNMYTGAGQSPRRAGGSVSREPQPAPPLRFHQTANYSGASAPTSNKKRLVGDSGIPVPSGSANGAASPVASLPAISTVPFPLESPARPQRVPPPTNAASSSRPAIAGQRNGPFSTAIRAPFARPEAPRQPSPLRKSNLDLSISTGGSDVDDSFEERKPGPRKSDPSQRTHASATILDIVMDETNPLPPVKSRVAAELKNPFEAMHPTPPRVSTPVRRPTPRLSRPWTVSPSPASSPAPPKRGIESDNILDQIDSTVPKPSPVKPLLSSENDLPGVVNPFASTSTSSGNLPIGSGQRIRSPPITAFRSIPSMAPIDEPRFGFPSVQPTIPTKVSSNFASAKVTTFPFGVGAKLDKMLSVPVTINAALVDASRIPKPSERAFPALGPAAKKEPAEVVILDDSDSEDDTHKITVAPAKSMAAQREELIVDEIDDKDEAHANEGNDVGDNLRSGSPSPTKQQVAQHASSVEEVDENVSKGGPPLRLNGSRFGGTVAIPNAIPNGLHAPFKTTSPVVPSPLRQVSLPLSDGEDLSSTEDENEPRPDATLDTTKVASANGMDAVFIKGPERREQKSLTGMEVNTPKARALQLPLRALTVYEIVARDQLTTSHEDAARGPMEARSKAKAAVKSLPASELPKFDLSATPSSAFTSQNPSPPMSAASGKSFDWAAAGLKPPSPATSSASRSSEWVCGTCACKSPASADKCIVCEAPRVVSGVSTPKALNSTTPPAPTPPQVIQAFDWAAAGLKPNVTSSGTEWTCPICSVKSPLTSAKCIACEEPQPKSSSKLPTPAVSPPLSASSQGSFNWAAAGMKAPEPNAGGKWTCEICMISNDASVSQCAACESPRPRV